MKGNKSSDGKRVLQGGQKCNLSILSRNLPVQFSQTLDDFREKNVWNNPHSRGNAVAPRRGNQKKERIQNKVVDRIERIIADNR